MNSVKTIDVRGLEHAKREQMLFPNLWSLKSGESIRLIIEFNPVPLIYLLNAQGGFQITHEKQGPSEWILNIKRTTATTSEASAEHKTNIHSVLLTELRKESVSEETREKVKKLLREGDVDTLKLLEQELIRGDLAHNETERDLCNIYLETVRDKLVSRRIEVASPHPVHTFMEEHKLILKNLRQLSELIRKTYGSGSFENEDLTLLRDITHHLVEAESHHQREEDVLFPMLQKHDITAPQEIMKRDHVEFRQRKRELYRLAYNPQDYSPEEFKRRALETGGYLAQELEGHIFKEDNIIYQIALQLLSLDEWNEVRRECDKIGYCCFSPEVKNHGDT